MPHPYHELRKKQCCDPKHFDKYGIYDIFHNDLNVLNIICYGSRPDQSISVFCQDDRCFKQMDKTVCKHGHSTVYSISFKLTSDKIRIKVAEEEFSSSVSKYPSYEGKILMSTMVKNEDSYICQWIDHHLNLGIDHFIIYDNHEAVGDRGSYHSVESDSNLPKLLKDYISQNIVTLIRWPYAKRRAWKKTKAGISGQATSQTHSLHAFRSADWISLTDIDEYLCFRNPKIKNIPSMLASLERENFLQNSSKKFTKDSISGFFLCSKMFYNHDFQPEQGEDFLKITNSSNRVSWQRRKFFVRPKFCHNFSVHTPTMSTAPDLRVPSKKDYEDLGEDQFACWNHYAFLNKVKRNRAIPSKDCKPQADDYILRENNRNLLD